MLSFELQGRTMSESFDEPESVVIIDELCNHEPCFFDGLKAMDVKDLLLERSMETLDDAVTLRAPHERWRVGKPQELELGLEVV